MYQPNTSYESETQIKHNQRKYNERESTPRDTGERGNTPRYCYRQDGDRNESATQNRRGALNEGQISRRKPGSVVDTDIRYEPRTVENRHHVSQYDIPRYGHENVVGNETYPPLEARTERYGRDDRRRGTIGQSEVPITSTRNSKYRERETDYSRPKYYDRDRIETTERCEERNVNTGNVKRRAPVSRKQIPDLKSEEFIPMDSRMNEHRTYSIDEYSDYEEEMRNEIDRKMMQEQLDRLQQQKRRALSIQAREEAIR